METRSLVWIAKSSTMEELANQPPMPPPPPPSCLLSTQAMNFNSLFDVLTKGSAIHEHKVVLALHCTSSSTSGGTSSLWMARI